MDPVSRKTHVLTYPGFVADSASITQRNGRQVDWPALPTAWEGNIPPGTIVSLTIEGKIVPRSTTTETAVGILVSSANQDSRVDALSGYGIIVGGVIYENLLRENTDINFDTWKTELQAAGTGFVFETYSDNRGA